MASDLQITTVGPVNFSESVSGDVDAFTARIVNGQASVASWQLTNAGANVWSGHVASGDPNDPSDCITVTVPLGVEIRGYTFSVSNVQIANPASLTVTRLSGTNSTIATHPFTNISNGTTLGADGYTFLIGNGTVVADWQLTLNVAYAAPFGTTTQNQTFSGNVLTLDSDATNNSDTIIKIGLAESNVGVAVNGTAGGTFKVNANGSFVFDPGDDFRYLDDGEQTTTAVIYTWRRGDGTEVNGTAAITVTGVNDAPEISGNTAITVSEGATGVLATYTVYDPDSSDSPTLSLAGDDADLFTLTNGELRFKNTPDYEAPADKGGDNTYNVTIVGDDGTVTTSRNVTVTVENVGPQIDDQAVGAVAEDATAGTVVGTVVAAEATAYAITAGNDAGIFAIDSTGKITIADPTALDFEAASSHVLTVEVADGSSSDTATVTVTVTDVDEPPSGSGTLTQTTLDDNAGPTALFGDLTVVDLENETDLALRVTLSNPAAGVVTGVNGTTVVNAGGGVYTISGLTAAAANTALDNLRFTPTNNTATSGTFSTDISVEVSDGSTGYQTVVGPTAVTINIVNDAPVLGAGNPSLPPVAENADAGTIAGLTVADLLSQAGASDPEGSTLGMAVTAADGSHGSWQYSRDGGATWNDIAGVSATAALLLAETDRIRFVPTADTAGVVNDGLSFKAWDKTAGVAGDSADTTTGIAFSSAIAGVDVTVTNVPPVIADATPPVVNEDAAVGTVVHVVDSSGGDPNGLTNWRITGGNAGNLFAINSEGEISLAGALDYETAQQHVLTVAVDDESGATDTAQITINVGDVDDTPPTVASIVVSGAPEPTANAIAYTVTFSELVSGVDASDFTLVAATGNAAGSIGTPVSTDGGLTWTVPVTGITGTGTLRLVLNGSGTGIADGAGNVIEVGYTGGAVHTVDRDAPTLDGGASAPTHGALTVMIVSNVVVAFNETVAFGTTGVVRLVEDATGATVVAFDVATAAGGVITAADGSTASLAGDRLTIDPAANLAELTRYRVEIDTGALVDAAGNSIAAVGDGVYEFTTEDASALYSEAAGFATAAADGNGDGIADADNGILNDRVASDGDDSIVITDASHLVGSTIDGLGGSDTVTVSGNADFTTAAAVQNVETLAVSGAAAASVTLGAGKGWESFSTITGNGATSLTVAVGGNVDLTATTLTQVKDLAYTGGNGTTLTLNAAQAAMVGALGGTLANNVGSATLAVDGADVDLSAVGLTGFGALRLTHVGDAVLTVDGLNGITEVTAVAGHVNTLRTTGTQLDLSALTLNNVTRFATTNATGTTFIGSTGADVIVGHSGADTLIGGAGADTLTGGAGADTFVDVDGDTITDFGSGDVIRLTGVTGLTGDHLKFEGGVLKVDVDGDGVFDDATDVFVALSGSLTGTFSVADSGGNSHITYTPPASGGGGGGTSTPPTTTTQDGTTVQQTTTTDNTGRQQVSIVVAPPPPDREDDLTSSSGDLADITLASAGSGDTAVPVLQASLPTGIGLTVEGPVEWQGTQQALADLMARIAQTTDDGSASQEQMMGIGQAFLDAVPQDAELLVRTVVPVATGDAEPTAPLVITGATDYQEALVIDVRGLPSGTVIQLQNVDFAAIVGAVEVRGGAGRNVVTGDDFAQIIVLGPDDDVLHGGGGDDVIGSEGGRDRLFGDAGDDTVFGGADHDFLSGGSGNDILRGDSGMDAVLFTGAWNDYTITRGADRVLTTVDNRGDDGTDRVETAEILVFSDRIDLAHAPGLTGCGFDEAAYLSANPDVAAAVQNGWFLSGYQHFILYGNAENRSANPLFDAEWYLAHNPDVAAAVEAGWMTAWQHYTSWGWREGRDAGPFFDLSRYLDENPDVAAAEIDPLVHYLHWGWSEGRAAYQADMGIFG